MKIQFKCNICHRSFPKQRNLSIHKLWHNLDYIKNYKQKRRRQDIWNKQKEIIELYIQGKSIENVAKINKCSPTLIRSILKENKIKIREQVPFQLGNKLSSGLFGDKNGNWKGDNVKYDAIHIWIKNHKPKPKLCEICNKNPAIELANKTGKYTRNIDDYWWSCISCHRKLDKTIKNIKHMKEKLEGRL